MRADLVQNRVSTVGIEARADPGKLDRRADKGLAQAGAVSAVVAAVTALVGIAYRSEGFALVGEACGKDILGADALVADMQLLEHDLEAVVLANIPGEIHVVAEDVGHLHGQVVAHAGFLGGQEQRAGDISLGKPGAYFRLNKALAECIAVIGAINLQCLQIAHLRAKGQQLTCAGKFEFQFLADLEAGKALGFLAAVDHRMQCACAQSYLIEKDRERVTAGHGDRKPFSRFQRRGCLGGDQHRLFCGGRLRGLRCGRALRATVRRQGGRQCDRFLDQGIQFRRTVYKAARLARVACFQVQGNERLAGLDIGGGNNEQKDAQRCGYTTGSHEVAFRV